MNNLQKMLLQAAAISFSSWLASLVMPLILPSKPDSQVAETIEMLSNIFQIIGKFSMWAMIICLISAAVAPVISAFHYQLQPGQSKKDSANDPVADEITRLEEKLKVIEDKLKEISKLQSRGKLLSPDQSAALDTGVTFLSRQKVLIEAKLKLIGYDLWESSVLEQYGHTVAGDVLDVDKTHRLISAAESKNKYWQNVWAKFQTGEVNHLATDILNRTKIIESNFNRLKNRLQDQEINHVLADIKQVETNDVKELSPMPENMDFTDRLLPLDRDVMFQKFRIESFAELESGKYLQD